MGSVFLAQRHGRDDVCIVKVINEELLDNPTVVQRFWREANVAATLNHDKIAKLTDAGKEDGRIYLAIEFIKGVEFEELMRELMAQQRMLPPALTLTIAQEVLQGLEYAHNFEDSNGQHLEIVHRDLSPRNIMITFGGEAKIIDFGLVRTKLGNWQTQAGMMMGTLRYMSPEQATASPLDGRSDLYSFATVLYEALTGRFLIPDGEMKDILRNVVLREAEPLCKVNPAISEALSAVIAKAMAKAADDRYPDAQSFRLALLEAAPELSTTPAHEIGRFVETVFPAKKAKADANEMMARPAVDTDHEPEHELTRAGAIELASADRPEVEVTRAAMLDDLAEDRPAPALQPWIATHVLDQTRPTVADGHAAGRAEPALQAALPPAPTWVQTKTGLLTTVVLAAGAASAVTALLMAQALKPEPIVLAPPPTRPANPVRVARGLPAPAPTKVQPQRPRTKQGAVPQRKAVPKTEAPVTKPTKVAAQAPKTPVSPQDRATALLKDTRLTARQRSGLEGCFEQAKFVNRSAPDFGPCFTRAKKYLGKQP